MINEISKFKKIEKEIIVNASRNEVWNAFTTTEGAKTFFAPNANIELRLDGPYELYFNIDDEPGSRGSEGCKVLSYLPEEMLSFSWNAPPEYPEIRKQRTFVVLKFDENIDGKTIVKTIHAGWKEGGQWDEVYSYFESAWDIVMNNLKKRFDKGPLFNVK